MIPVAPVSSSEKQSASAGESMGMSMIGEMLSAKKIFLLKISYDLVNVAESESKEVMAVVNSGIWGALLRKKAALVPLNEMIRRKLTHGAIVHGVSLDWYNGIARILYTIKE